MDPLSVGIFNVISGSPLESTLFALGGMMTIVGIMYAAIIGIAGDKHKTIGITTMFLTRQRHRVNFTTPKNPCLQEIPNAVLLN